MMQEGDLQELAELVSKDAPILSLYLNVDPHRRSTEEHKLNLRRLLERHPPILSGPNASSITSTTGMAEVWLASAVRVRASGASIRCWSLSKTSFSWGHVPTSRLSVMCGMPMAGLG
jgi:hypothetical protein